MSALESRIRTLIDDDLIAAYWEATTHFKTKDLVLFFNEDDTVDPVTALPRERLQSNPDLPAAFRSKLERPASAAAVHLKSSEASFWFMAMFADGTGGCVAVNGKLISPGGHA